jgi:hypothetical protein
MLMQSIESFIRRPASVGWMFLSGRGPGKFAVATLSAVLMSAACSETSIARRGPTEQRVVTRVYGDSLVHARAKILELFTGSRSQLPEPFDRMRANALIPPLFRPDWLVTVVDPGGYLDAYKRMPPGERVDDLLIQDPTGDFYWDSEYRTIEPVDRPVRFHCGLIIHLVTRGPSRTEVQVYELVPSVWAGEHWAFAAHGVGVGRYHDIRFVEPTVTDRIKTLDLFDRVLKN